MAFQERKGHFLFMDLLHKFETYVRRHRLVEERDKILIAVSGGVDSVVLLKLFLEIREKWKLSLSVAHLNHGLRGESADRDESFVKDLTHHFGIAFYAKKADVKSYAKTHKLSLEESAREVRFRFLLMLQNEHDVDKIALGHHAKDQAETILMNIVRGSGIRGLRGIKPMRGSIIRPLLFAMKEEIVSYAAEWGLDYVEDASNQDRCFLRNRIRWDVLPVLERAMGSHVIPCISRTGESILEAEAFIDDAVNQAKAQSIVDITDNEIILDIYKFLSYFRIVQKGVTINILEEELQKKDIDSSKIERILALARDGESGKKIELGEGKLAIKSGQHLVFLKYFDSMTEISIELGEPVVLKKTGFEFQSTVMNCDVNEIVFSTDANIEYIDFDRISLPLRIRSMHEGDAFYPLGMNQKKKLHDFFIDKKVPNYRRSSIPLLVGGDDIIWVGGFRIDDRVKITKKTKNILKLELSRRE